MKKNILWSALALIVAGLLTVSFAACGSDNENENTPKTETNGNGESSQTDVKGSAAVAGTWIGQEYGDDDEQMTIVLNADGTGTFLATYDDSYSGLEVDEGTLTYKMTSDTEGTMLFKWEDDDDSYSYSSHQTHNSYSSYSGSYSDDYDYEPFYFVIQNGTMYLYDGERESYSYSGTPTPEYVLTKRS